MGAMPSNLHPTSSPLISYKTWRSGMREIVLFEVTIRERGIIFYLVMAQEFWDFANLAIA